MLTYISIYIDLGTDLDEGIRVVVILFSGLFLMLPSVEFVFFILDVHEIDTSIAIPLWFLVIISS